MISTPSVSPSTTGASAAGRRLELAAGIGKTALEQRKQETGAATSDPHGEAVIVTLSGDGSAKQNGDARQAGQPGRDLSQAFREHGFIELRSPEDIAKQSAYWEEVSRKSEMASQEALIEMSTTAMKYYQEKVEFLEKTEPEPSRVLQGQEAEDTLRMLNAFRQGDVTMGISETGRRSWGVGDKVYALYPDGTLTVGTAGVPESEDEKQYLLENARNFLNEYSSDLSEAKERLAALRQTGQEVLA